MTTARSSGDGRTRAARWWAVTLLVLGLGAVLAGGLWTLGSRSTDIPVARTATPGEPVPDLADRFTISSVRSGPWSSPSTWDTGRLPGAGETVRISEQTTVVYDLVGETPLEAVGVAGVLTFRPDVDTELRVTHLLVYRDGALIIGSRDDPILPSVGAEVVINDRPLGTGTVAEPGPDPVQYGNGLLVWGGLSLHGAEKGPVFLRLAGEPRAGDTELSLVAEPVGWTPGDRVVLPDSRLVTPSDLSEVGDPEPDETGVRGLVRDPHWETAEIDRIGGTRVTLTQPLTHDHPAAKRDDGSIVVGLGGEPLLPHVANLSRNVVIRSENPDGTRGHTIAFRGASVQIANAAFRGLGRTTVRPLDNTRLDDDGRPVHLGINQAARYPVHMHHVVDPAQVDAGRFQFEITGSVIENARRWGLSIHGSHFGLIRDNVVVDVDGAGIVTEDGSETGNVLEGNLVTAVRGSGLAVDARRPGEGVGHEGAGFWLGSDNNVVRNNVAAGVRAGGFTLFRTTAGRPFPRFPRGAAMGQGSGRPRVFEFVGNEAYGAAETGVELWDSKECAACTAAEATLLMTTVWHSRTGVTYDYHADHYVIQGLLVHGDPESLAGTHGVVANHSQEAVIRAAEIQYVEVGIDGGGGRNRRLEVETASVTARTGLRIRRGSSWDPLQFARFRDVSLTPVEPGEGRLVELSPDAPGPGVAKLTVRRPIGFWNFQNDADANFELFYDDQAPDRVMPESADPVLGCPDAGMTNAECLEAHGVATGGELATCDARLDGLDGFACPMRPEPSATASINR